MLFWLLVVSILCFAWGFAAGATHEQYKPFNRFEMPPYRSVPSHADELDALMRKARDK